MQHAFQKTEYGNTWDEKDKIIYDLRQKLDACSNTQRNTVTELCDIYDESNDKDSIIHNMKQKMEEMKQMFLNFTEKLTTKDRIIHNMNQEREDLKQRLDACSQRGYLMNPGFQPPDCNVAVPPRHTLSIQPEECHDIARLQEELQHSQQMIEKLENEAQTRQQNIDRLKQNLLSLSEELEQTKADQERNHGRNVSVNNNYYGQTNVLNGSSNNTQIGNRNLMRNVQHSPWESVN